MANPNESSAISSVVSSADSCSENISSDNSQINHIRIEGSLPTDFKSNGLSTEELDFEKQKETHRHEREMTRYGSFGKIFGTEDNSSKALTFTIICIVLVIFSFLSLVSKCLVSSQEFIIKMFELIIPLITLAFGYFFGKQN